MEKVKPVTVCDICGKDIDIKSPAKIRIWGPGLPDEKFSFKLDLCSQCYIELMNYLNTKYRKE